MPHTLIIGYGNPLRGDDAAGYVAAELLRERIFDPQVETVSEQQLLPEMMQSIAPGLASDLHRRVGVGTRGQVPPHSAAAGAGMRALHTSGDAGGAAGRRAGACTGTRRRRCTI